MNRFELHRREDETGISGTGVVAEGIRFTDGTCALRWRTAHTSFGLYHSIDSVIAIHGHNGQTRVVWVDMTHYDDVRRRARTNCVQDGCENAPFASVGGLEQRASMRAPHWIPPEDAEEYLRAYRDEARSQYGEDWATCGFGWAPALTIEAGDGEGA